AGPYSLRLVGALPWDGGSPSLRALLHGSDKRLDLLGMTLHQEDGRVELRAATPEAVISFSAFLARGQGLALCDVRGVGLAPRLPAAQALVRLRDFDEDEAVLPALVSYPAGETWLRGAPPVPLALDEQDRLAVARWLYPPESW